MELSSLAAPQLLVLADVDDATPDNSRGKLFERFIAGLLADLYGFQDPVPSNLNVTSEGIELDVTAHHRLTGAYAVAECKAYTRRVASNELTNFYGKLNVERLEAPNAFGLICALPGLTADGEEKARSVARSDPNFRYLNATDIALELQRSAMVASPPSGLSDRSDDAVLITPHGLYGACLILDPDTRTPTHVAVWGNEETVPTPVLESLQLSDYSRGLQVIAASDASDDPTSNPSDLEPVLLPTVTGSTSDFEYQLPAGPKYFVGRKDITKPFMNRVMQNSGSLVLNAQSGWGKSSLALKFQKIVEDSGGVGMVFDARTAEGPRYIDEVLRTTAELASQTGLLRLPADGSWASLPSCIATLGAAEWKQPAKPLLVFFDQFENVFRDRSLTRAFRDLAFSSREVPGPFIVGFAWKTDLVGWTEDHPYQLRDEIRNSSNTFRVAPLGPSEVNTILRRLEKAADEKLLNDLRARLREYSQGLPWLLKKLADHILRELGAGTTQEELLAESLNVQSLFESDLGELNPAQNEVLRHIARYAPLLASEVTERYEPESVQSLVDRRLVVQVGDRLDIYWDIFRDFLNTGRVPIEDSYILRQTPRSVARVLSRVIAHGGSASVQELAGQLDTSENVIFNLSRELRLLGVTTHEPNQVSVIPEVLGAPDSEQESRRRVASALRRHRAYSTLRSLADRAGGAVTPSAFARDLPNAFPAVEVAATTWLTYARAFLFWMSYAGLVDRHGSRYEPTPDQPSTPTMRLLDPPSAMRIRPSVPQMAPRRPLEILERLNRGEAVSLPPAGKEREVVGTLVALGAVVVDADGRVLKSAVLTADTNPATLLDLLAAAPGGQAGIDLLESDPAANPMSVGAAIRDAVTARWTDASTRSIGGHFRAWCRQAGMALPRARRRSSRRKDYRPPE